MDKKPSVILTGIMRLFDRPIDTKEFNEKIGGHLRLDKTELRQAKIELRQAYPQCFQGRHGSRIIPPTHLNIASPTIRIGRRELKQT